MARNPLLCLALLALQIACSGAGRSGEPPADPEQQERNLRAAQESGLEALCERLVDCAIESARANMPAEEVAKLDLEKIAPARRAECEEEGARSRWSPRQVRVVQRCVADAVGCDALQTCLDEAQKKRPG